MSVVVNTMIEQVELDLQQIQDRVGMVEVVVEQEIMDLVVELMDFIGNLDGILVTVVKDNDINVQN